MTPEHLKTIDILTKAVAQDVRFDALILIGSLARGEERERSDVDCLLVDSSLTIHNDGHDVDVHSQWGPFPSKVSVGCISKSFLEEAIVRAPEPQRFAFLHAKVLYTRDPSVEELVSKIGVYPEKEREQKLKMFYSQIPVHLSYLKLGEFSENIFLLTQTAQKLAFFCGRLILAHNRMLYPNRKQFMAALERAPEKPDRFIETMELLLSEPSIAHAEALMDLVFAFQEWEEPEEGVITRFCKDSEQYWKLNHSVAPEDC